MHLLRLRCIMRSVFVSEVGLGNLALVKSTEKNPYHDFDTSQQVYKLHIITLINKFKVYVMHRIDHFNHLISYQ